RDLGLTVRGWTRGAPGLLELPSLRRELSAFAPQVVNAHTGSAQSLALMIAPASAVVLRTRGDARPPEGNLLTRLSAARSAGFIAANSSLREQLAKAFPDAK